MSYLRALAGLLRTPFASANREALGFAVPFYGLVLGAGGLVAWGLWRALG